MYKLSGVLFYYWKLCVCQLFRRGVFRFSHAHFFISPLYILFRLVVRVAAVVVSLHLRLLLVELLDLGQLRLDHILGDIINNLISKDGGVFERLLGVGDLALFDFKKVLIKFKNQKLKTIRRFLWWC